MTSVATHTTVAPAGVRLPVSVLTGTALLLFAGITASMLVTGHSLLLTQAYPAMALAVGAVLYATDPGRYVAFALWLWMLSPFVRRVVDAQNGWNPQNLILLAPMLVCALGAIDVARHLTRLGRVIVMPFTIALVSLLGGLAVGLTQTAPILVVYAAVTWAAPVLLGVHIAMHPERHEQYEHAIMFTLPIGVMLLGVYGLAQFMSPFVWDRLWMTNSRMNSIGTPEPFHVRVFSTMNAPGPFAQFLSASLLVLMASRSRLKVPAIMAGIAVFLLSLTRSAWLGFAIGFLLLLFFVPGRVKRSAIFVVGLGTATLVALESLPLPTALDHMRNTVELRITSMVDLPMDDSFRARSYLIPAVLSDIDDHPLGSGLGATLVGGARGNASSRLQDQGLYLDNGVLEILLVLGWFGGPLFLVGTFLALVLSARGVLRNNNGYVFFAGAVALLSQVAGGTVFSGVGGAMFWVCVAMALTAAPRVASERVRILSTEAS